jgi:hypothetical protein
MAAATVIELRRREFDARQSALQLRRAVFEANRPEEMPALVEAERTLQQISDQRAAAERATGIDDGEIVKIKPNTNLLGPATTGLEVKVDLRMSSVVTSLVHLFNASEQPLVTYEILNTGNATKRLRLISYVEDFSARAVETVEVERLVPAKRAQLPTFFPDRLARLNELTRASLNVEVQDLDARTEVHRTIPVWLLARTTAPLQVKDPSTGTWKDMTPYLGAFVTPNAPAIMTWVRRALDKQPRKRLVGYQVDKDEVVSEVQAVFDALAESGVSYVNSIIDFTPEIGSSNQRVRLPRESLGDRSANCIDGTVLMASLLEAISLNPAIVVIPGHAFLGWETWKNNGEWRYLETTMMSTASFGEACTKGDSTAQTWLANDGGANTMFKRWSLRDLRAQGITPLE